MGEVKVSRKKGDYILPNDLIRLHVSLYWVDEDEAKILQMYGSVTRGKTITRDILVPKNMPLSSLHFTLQRALGFQNSHLHHFELFQSDLQSLTGDKMENLLNMRGIILTQDRGPYVVVGPTFKKGSFKKWLRKQYTWPFHYYNDYLEEFNTLDGEEPDEEMLLSQITPDALYCRLKKVHTTEDQGRDSFFLLSRDKIFSQEILGEMIEGGIQEGQGDYFKWSEKERDMLYRLVPCEAEDEKAMKLDILRLGDFSVREGLMAFDYENNPSYVIERLPIGNVLALSSDYLPYDDDGKMIHTVTGLKQPQVFTREEIQKALKKVKIIFPKPFTDMLIYNYDFGDNWRFLITGSKGCSDLVEEGVLSAEDLQKSIEKVQKEDHPVLIAKDGDMLIDDVGNVSGFCDFLMHVKPKADMVMKQAPDYWDYSGEDFFSWFSDDDDEDLDDEDLDEEDLDEEEYEEDEWVYEGEADEDEEDDNGMTVIEHLEWARSQGWHRNDFEDIDLL